MKSATGTISAPNAEPVKDVVTEAILAELARLGGGKTQEDALIFEGNKMILPETMLGKVDEAISYLQDYLKQAEEEHAFIRKFRFRPLDGANALQVALKKIWGSTGIGKATYTMFGKIPPIFETINTGVSSTTQVPQGWIDFPPLGGKIHVGAHEDPEVGPIFNLVVQAPRKYKVHIEGLFKAVQDVLETQSIYKAKAIDGGVIPGFFDPFRTDRTKVIYSDLVTTQLEANVWSLLNQTEVQRVMKLPLKRTVLIEGPFGTGKSLAAQLTAQEATANGWTFVFCRPGVDDLNVTMKTAHLYAPAVVFFEDIDVISQDGDPTKITKLLDLFDGITNKGTELVCILTTNHVDRIHKAMLRPGRLDAVIHIGELDSSGYERLIKACVAPAYLSENTDYERIGEAYKGFLPSFAKEAIDRAIRYAIVRSKGVPQILTTEDFVEAAEGLRPQLDLMHRASEGIHPPSLDLAVGNAVQAAVQAAVDNAALLYESGDTFGMLKLENCPN